MTLSNLPPGVTQQMIDDHFSGPCEDCEEGRHDDCMGQDGDCRCVECEERARQNYDESLAEERRLERRYGRDE